MAMMPSSEDAAQIRSFEDACRWVGITDTTVVSASKSLMAGQSKKVAYSFGGHNYEASLKKGKSNAADIFRDVLYTHRGSLLLPHQAHV